jgi:hypothetical protein
VIRATEAAITSSCESWRHVRCSLAPIIELLRPKFRMVASNEVLDVGLHKPFHPSNITIMSRSNGKLRFVKSAGCRWRSRCSREEAGEQRFSTWSAAGAG